TRRFGAPASGLRSGLSLHRPPEDPGIRCCPSSLYTFPAEMFRPGLARDCHPRLREDKFEVSPNLGSSASPVSQASTQIGSSPLRLPVPPRPHGWLCKSVYHTAGARTHRLVSGFRLVFLFRWPRPHDVDGGGVELRLDVGGVVFFDHFDAGAAVFGDLVDVGALHQAETYICVPEAIGCSRQALTVEPEVLLLEDCLEKLALPLRKNQVCRSRKAQFFGRVGCRRFCSVLVRASGVNARRSESGLQSLKGE